MIRARIPLMAGVLASALASCAPGASSTKLAGPPAAAPQSGAARLADALASADAAVQAGNDSALARPLAMIRGMGARPLDDATAATTAQWEARLPDQTPPLRGRALGPGYRHGMLGAGGDVRIEQTFLSGQKASIALSSPDAVELRLQVVDGTSQSVCQHTASRPICEWVPVFTQRHLIHVINPAKRKARFYLVVE
ncbi:hypothetical protein [Blastomonas fulva]|uniref:hypothetical protein n=1 Tax=Blastomonas fulva TaxID=1550728 RepID=UPI0025A49678|nr:hypothetical protein [Blastomonas fulva]MDM7928714.1 hypothetical protein [Blastomonas fulva]MDM7964500.1 hypothetical protein [Blastomonas fulva]